MRPAARTRGSDKLKLAGDTAPTEGDAAPVSRAAATAAASRAAVAYAALRPVIAAACKRVEIKTAKAFEAHETGGGSRTDKSHC